LGVGPVRINLDKDRIFGIDLARTIAISMVILVHTTGIGFGRFGVQLFFVISGYLLALFYETQTSVSFLIHRAFRLFPLAILFILFFYLDQIGSAKDVLLNLSLAQNLWWGWNSFPGGWSISSEWIFSIILIFIARARLRYLVMLIMLSCLLQFASGLYIYLIGGVNGFDSSSEYIFKTWVNTTNPYINLGFFVAGILIRRLNNNLLSLKISILSSVVLVMILEDFIIGPFMLGWQIAIPALFILCLKASPRRGGVVRICNFIGKRTYGTFFIHFLIWNNLSLLIPDSALEFLTGSYIGKLIQFFLVYSISLVGGSLTYKLIEKPSITFSYKLVRQN
jgi:peptidoglycan/LPS O-acetylase OafA/YrhL